MSFYAGDKVVITKSTGSVNLAGRKAVVKAVDAFQRGYLTLKVGKSKKVFFVPEGRVRHDFKQLRRFWVIQWTTRTEDGKTFTGVGQYTYKKRSEALEYKKLHGQTSGGSFTTYKVLGFPIAGGR